MRRLAILFAIIAAFSAAERIALSPRFAAFAASVMRGPLRFTQAIRQFRGFWRQQSKLLPLARVN